jgi:hypothetical protein
MGTVRDVVTFDHLLVGEQAALIADSAGPDRLEEGPAMLVFLLHELGVVVELVVRGADGQKRGARELQHGHNGFLEKVHGDVRGLIDDDDVSTGSTGRLRGGRQHGKHTQHDTTRHGVSVSHATWFTSRGPNDVRSTGEHLRLLGGKG